MRNLFAFILLSISLMSCGKFDDGSSIWQAGMWIVPLLPFLGGIAFFWAGKKAADSGSKINPIYGGGEGGNVPFWKTGWPLLGIGCWLGTIGIIIWQNLEK